MKRFIRLLFLTLVCITLVACRQQKQENNENTNEDKVEKMDIEDQKIEELASSTAKVPPPKSVITTHKFERQLLNDDSTVTLLRGEYMYPQLENTESAPSVDKVNKEIQDNTETQFVKSFKDGAAYVKEFYGNEGANSKQLPFVTEQQFEVTNNQNYIVSFKVTSYEDFGGAHPNVLQSAYTYDVRTGERLPASYFTGGSEDNVKQFVGQSFYTVVTEQPDAFYENAQDILSNGQFEFGFYIRDDSITFFINPYIIAPYAAGIQEVSILLR